MLVLAQPFDQSPQGRKRTSFPEVLRVFLYALGQAYPNFRQVIPTETKERITLERELLLSALHRASILASEKSQSVKLNFAKNTLTITATTPEVGEAKETLSINYKGKELTIAFNPQYMMDPLRNLDADEVFIELADELSPGVIKVNAPFLYVLMPMRLS